MNAVCGIDGLTFTIAFWCVPNCIVCYFNRVAADVCARSKAGLGKSDDTDQVMVQLICRRMWYWYIRVSVTQRAKNIPHRQCTLVLVNALERHYW